MNFAQQAPTIVPRPPVVVPDVTTSIPPLGHDFKYPHTLHELLSSSSGSAAGHSAVSSYLTCPEQSRLRSLGVRRRPSGYSAMTYELSARDYGVLLHFLRAVRILHGQFIMELALDHFASEMDPDQFMKTKLLFRTYEQNFKLNTEPFDYLGVELEVITDIGDGAGGQMRRSARYDTVVRDRVTGDVLSFECKSMARSGQGQLSAYMSQAYVQVALWNRNAALVQAYGPMVGIVFDMLVKTEIPKTERTGSIYVSKLHQTLAVDYLRLPETGLYFTPRPDGVYPRFLHSCWGKYSPCDYIGLCHEGLYGDYTYKDGTSL